MSRLVEIRKPWITEHIIALTKERRRCENARNETEE
jgi:hypothetical protein